MDNILELVDISKSFGGIQAIQDISLLFKPAINGLIGPNGAGKTTLFNMISGVYGPDEGKIMLSGMSMENKNLHERHNMGISRTFQNIRLFEKMTVLDNVLVGFTNNIQYNFLDNLIINQNYKAKEKQAKEFAEKLLNDINLYEYRHDYPSNLPYGHQRKLEIVRALSSNPKVLLLDEPAAGMNESETEDLMKYINELDNGDLIIILIEHDMKLVMNICKRIAVINHGRLIADDIPSKISTNREVRDAYLGEEENYDFGS